MQTNVRVQTTDVLIAIETQVRTYLRKEKREFWAAGKTYARRNHPPTRLTRWLVRQDGRVAWPTIKCVQLLHPVRLVARSTRNPHFNPCEVYDVTAII